MITFDLSRCVGCGSCVRAVSYTHLDVYKRQDQDLPSDADNWQDYFTWDEEDDQK